MKRPTTTVNDNDDCDLRSWSYDLIPDILMSIILRLGVPDFVAFSGVCKSWRTVALAKKNMFFQSRRPMKLCVSTRVAEKKVCYFDDSEGRKFKIILPSSSQSCCLGLVSGYVILFRRKNRDFRLLNPITRHKLHFPSLLASHRVPDTPNFSFTLVFSPTMSTWVFMFSELEYLRLGTTSKKVSFAFSGKQGCWTHLASEFSINDLCFFQGRIYTLNTDNNNGLICLCEVRLGPTPTLLTLLKMKNPTDQQLVRPHFATWGEKLYLLFYCYRTQTQVPFETDFENMQWVKLAPQEVLKEHAWSAKKMSGFSKIEFWHDPCQQFHRFNRVFYSDDNAKNYDKSIHSTGKMWYFPHKCLDVNLLQEEQVIE